MLRIFKSNVTVFSGQSGRLDVNVYSFIFLAYSGLCFCLGRLVIYCLGRLVIYCLGRLVIFCLGRLVIYCLDGLSLLPGWFVLLAWAACRFGPAWNFASNGSLLFYLEWLITRRLERLVTCCQQRFLAGFHLVVCHEILAPYVYGYCIINTNHISFSFMPPSRNYGRHRTIQWLDAISRTVPVSQLRMATRVDADSRVSVTMHRWRGEIVAESTSHSIESCGIRFFSSCSLIVTPYMSCISPMDQPDEGATPDLFSACLQYSIEGFGVKRFLRCIYVKRMK